MNERVVFINVKDNADEAEKNFNNLNDEIKDTEKTTEGVADNTAKIEKSSKGATKGLKSVGSAVKGLGLAFKALGIGLVISAFAVLKDIFTQNQKVADTLNTVFETMSIIFNEVTRVVVSVYESVREATGGFDALGKVMGGLLDLVIAPFKATFFGIKLAIQAVQLAWEQSVFGDGDPKTIKNLRKEIELTRQDLVGVGQDVIKAGGQIVDNFVEAVGEVGSIVTETAKGITDISVKAAFEQAKLNVEVQNQAKIAAAQQSLLIEKYDRQAEKLRQIRDEERNTIDERIKANDDLREVLDSQEKAMLRAADMQVKAARFEFEKNKSIENRIALIEAQSNREGVLAQIEGFRSEQLANDLALDKEKIELVNAKIDAEQELSMNEKRFVAERIEDEQMRLDELIRITQEEKLLEEERLQNKINQYKQGTQARLDAEIEYLTTKQELDQQLIELETQKAKKQEQIEMDLAEAKKKLTYDSLSAVNDLVGAFAGENEKQQKRAFEISKAINIAQALMDTYKGATAIFASVASSPIAIVNPASPFIAAASAVASGLANVATISRQKFNSSGGGVGSPSVPNVAGNTSTQQLSTPNFNVVGATGISQTEELQPVKAYVVSGDVTTAQSLDRNRIQNATF